jgi:hypothetical protein
MSYESKMYEQFAMPARKQVEQALLRALLKHGGVIKEFGVGQEIVDEIADGFGLTEDQRSAFLQTVYRKENRVKKSFLWHRLLFRAADSLAKEKVVSRPTQTFHLTNKKEWMLTEKGFDEALKLSNIPAARKGFLPTKSYEVQKIVKKINESQRPENHKCILYHQILEGLGIMNSSEHSRPKRQEYFCRTEVQYIRITTQFVGIVRTFSINKYLTLGGIKNRGKFLHLNDVNELHRRKLSYSVFERKMGIIQ